MLLVLLAVALLLLLDPAPTGDGIRWTDDIVQHRLDLNPNYLLMQPLAMLLHRLLSAIATIPGTAFQQWLTVAAGVGVLWGLQRALLVLAVPFAGRALALGFCAFAHQFVVIASSDHIKLLVGPALVASLLLLLRWQADGRRATLAAAAVAAGFSVLLLVNSALWAAAAGLLVLLWRGHAPARRLADAAVYGGVLLATAGPPFLLAYRAAAEGQSFVAWLTGYGAGGMAEAQGGGGLLGLGRGLVAVPQAFVYPGELTAAVKARLWGLPEPAAGPVEWLAVLLMALLFAAAVLVAVGLVRARPRLAATPRAAVAFAIAMIASFSAFGLWWGYNEEEFWFQVVPPSALLVGLWWSTAPAGLARRTVAAVLVAVAAFNVGAFAVPRALEPYEAYVAESRAALAPQRAFVVHDGTWPIFMVLRTTRGFDGAVDAVNLEGRLDELGDAARVRDEMLAQVAAARAAGRPVYVFGLFEASPLRHPWGRLAAAGVAPETFAAPLRALGDWRKETVAAQPAWRLVEPAAVDPPPQVE